MFAVILFFLTDSIIPWCFAVVYWLIGVPFVRYLQEKYDDLLHPAGPLLIVTFLYAFASILFYYNSGGETLYGDVISTPSFVSFCVACILGELGIIIGAIIAGRQLKGRQIQNVRGSVLLRLAIPVLIVIAATLAIFFFVDIIPAFNFLSVSAYSDWALNSRVAALEADAALPIRQILLTSMPSVLLIASGIFLIFRGKFLVRFIGIAILGANILTGLLSGARGAMFATLCSIVIFIHYRIKRFRLPTMVLGVFCSILLLHAIALVRSTSKLSEMVDIFVTQTTGNVSHLLDLSGSGELLVGLNLMKTIEAISAGDSKFNYGKGFVDDILCYIPRAIFPDRPLPLGDKFVVEFYPGVHEMGGGYGLFFLQDGYWSFGLIGVFVSLFAYSWALSRIYFYFKIYFDSDFMVLVYGFIYFPLVIASPRTGLMISFKSAAVLAFPFMFVLVFASLVGPPQETEKNTR